MKTWLNSNKITLALTLLVIFSTIIFVRMVQIPGHVDVITAQAMDMSQMRPPTGTAEVTFATVRTGTISDTVSYTGTIKAYNEEDIASRVSGVVQSIPVYPGDYVHTGELVAELDSAESDAKTDQALADAQSAEDAAQVAHLTHHLHHTAALDGAAAQVDASESQIASAQSDATAALARVTDAEAAVQSAIANADYWNAEITREKVLADAGAVSQQEYQNELSQSQTSASALDQATAKKSEAISSASSAQAKVVEAQAQLKSALAGRRMATADITIAVGQAAEAESNALSASAAARAAQVLESYSRITSLSSGVVVDRPVAPGSVVQEGATILRVAEIDRVRIQANVAVSDVAGIHPGTKVIISFPGSGGTAPIFASVTAVFPSANDETRTAIVEAVLPNQDHTLIPGEFASMKIARQTNDDELLVPADSVISQNGQNYLWVAQADTRSDTIYECVICHIHYSAEQAAQFNYRDPMDGGELVPVTSSKANGATATSGLKAHLVPITIGAANGKWTEVEPGEVLSGEQIVEQGQAGLTEGVLLKST